MEFFTAFEQLPVEKVSIARFEAITLNTATVLLPVKQEPLEPMLQPMDSDANVDDENDVGNDGDDEMEEPYSSGHETATIARNDRPRRHRRHRSRLSRRKGKSHSPKHSVYCICCSKK